MSKTTSKGVDAMQLLDVYLVLMEQVFESGPHVRLLLMLHGDSEQFTLNDLTTASGISAIQVRQALFELRNANVLDFDDETQIVKLKQRFL
jgi:transcription initiation factor IIE alpha subunit